jgi:hypothetical protein
MFVFGIIALVKGSFNLTRSRVVQKVPARVIGAILLLPFPAFVLIPIVVGIVKGAEVAAKGKEFTFQDAMNVQGPILIANAVIVAVCLLAALGIAIATARPAKPKKRRERDEEDRDEDYEDRPRPRDRDDEDDDQPRRRRRDDDDDDDPPRRRPPDDRFRER